VKLSDNHQTIAHRTASQMIDAAVFALDEGTTVDALTEKVWQTMMTQIGQPGDPDAYSYACALAAAITAQAAVERRATREAQS